MKKTDLPQTAIKTPQTINPHGNPFLQEGNWYKAALHVHTTTSDGDVDVATRLQQYQEAGYHVVAITDHWKTNDLTGFSNDTFLAINSMEMHPQTSTGAPAHHLVCLDLPHPFELDREQDAQSLVDKVREVGGKVIYAHPYWTEHSIEEMREISGFIGIEIYNSHCDLACRKGYNDVHVDQAFSKLGLFNLVAVDDVHRSPWINQAWTMIRAKELTKSAIMDAIEAGHTYSTTGPTITDFRVEDGTVRLSCPTASEVRFFFNGGGSGRFYTGKPDMPVTEVEWEFSEEKRNIKWIRAEVIDAEGKHAWTQPSPVDSVDFIEQSALSSC